MTDAMQCVILAGGLATRMRPLTQSRPKNLLPVNGEPFAEHQLRWLAHQGVDHIVYCIGHLGSMIRDFAGDGSRWGLDITYVDEGSDLRGTAGALRLAMDCDALRPWFFVLYGDSFVPAPLQAVADAHRTSGRPATMTVFRNEGRWERSNVVFRPGQVVRYDKWEPDPAGAGMAFVDAGLSVLTSSVVARVPAGEMGDLARLYGTLSVNGELAAYELDRRFYEIGSPEGLHELEAHLATGGLSR